MATEGYGAATEEYGGAAKLDNKGNDLRYLIYDV
jgi:hypothetical protein